MNHHICFEIFLEIYLAGFQYSTVYACLFYFLGIYVLQGVYFFPVGVYFFPVGVFSFPAGCFSFPWRRRNLGAQTLGRPSYWAPNPWAPQIQVPEHPVPGRRKGRRFWAFKFPSAQMPGRPAAERQLL